jgi:hypothetical protein
MKNNSKNTTIFLIQLTKQNNFLETQLKELKKEYEKISSPSSEIKLLHPRESN